MQTSLEDAIRRQQFYSIDVDANFLLSARLAARITREDTCCYLETRTLQFTPLQGIPAPFGASVSRGKRFLEIRWAIATAREKDEEEEEEEE